MLEVKDFADVFAFTTEPLYTTKPSEVTLPDAVTLPLLIKRSCSSSVTFALDQDILAILDNLDYIINISQGNQEVINNMSSMLCFILIIFCYFN